MSEILHARLGVAVGRGRWFELRGFLLPEPPSTQKVSKPYGTRCLPDDMFPFIPRTLPFDGVMYHVDVTLRSQSWVSQERGVGRFK